MKKIGIKGKLILSFLAASLIPVGAISYYAIWKAETAMTSAMMKQMEGTNASVKAQVQKYFESSKNRTIVLSHNLETKKALEKFTKAFEDYTRDANLSPVDLIVKRKALEDFYQKDFSPEFVKQNSGKSIDTRSILSRLTETQVALQASYIAENPNPIGSKHQFLRHPSESRYNSVHEEFHSDFKEFVDKFGYYDVFLIDAETGNVVYSVYKEVDFATSLKDGPYSTSPLAVAFKKALTLPEGDEAVMVDYQTYAPSFDSPASFMASPIYVAGKVKGVIALQLSFDEINKITLTKHTDLESLETFLVGSDFLMRSDTIGDPENRNVRASFRNPEKGKIKNDHMIQALQGKGQSFIGNDYIGREVVGSFTNVDILGHNWIVKTVVLKEHAFAAIEQMKFTLFIGALLAAILVSFAALTYARKLANQLTALADGLKTGAGIVSSTSQEIADVSTRLSEASTEQAASLQETVSSVDEISAMVQRNADAASSSSRASDSSLTAALRGKEKVEQMLGSIHDISKGNEEIMSSIQKSNQEINEIVHVIQAIADKTKVINDIVFQTKLLSFNASVEAARAGEHGKGFAVVAEEVGNLASMSGKAATEISDMLDKSVHRVTQIVEGTRGMMDTLVRSSKDKVDFGTRTAKECAGALEEIMRNVSSVNEMVREISTASQEQATGIREITKAMSELDQVTQQNTSSSNDASDTAKNLQEQASRLNTFVKELSILVHGTVDDGGVKIPSAGSPASTVGSKVVKLESFRSKPKESTKRVVGLEFTAPSANDDRFEDV